MVILAQAVAADDDELATLREAIAHQKKQIEMQSRQLEQQSQQLERMEMLVEKVSRVEDSPPQSPVKSLPEARSEPKHSPPKPAVQVTPEPKINSSSATDVSRVLDRSTVAGHGRGESFINSDFLKSIPLYGSNFRFSFGGYAKLDLIHDFSGSGDPTQFLLSQIPVDGSPQEGSYSEFQLRETRFHFEVRDTSPGTPHNKFYTEFDFFDLNSSTSPRLRHAYFQWGNLLAGQTWTTLTELRQLPLLLDFAAGDSLFGGRTIQIRWEQQLDSQFDWAVAIEDYSDSGIRTSDGQEGTARSNFPQLVSRMSWDWDRGVIMVGGALGENRWDGTGDVDDVSTLRWNLVTGGRVYLDEDKRHFLGFGASFGDGSPRDILTFGNAGTPSAVLNPDGSLSNVSSWNTSLGLHLQWCEVLSSNFSFAYAEIDPVTYLPETSIKSGSSIHGNIIYKFNERISAGVELMLGKQELVNGRTGTAERLQTSVFYYF